MNSEIGRQAADFNNLIIKYPLDDVLDVNFNFPLTNDAFLSPNHKTLFEFTLAYPWNVPWVGKSALYSIQKERRYK